MDQVSETMLKYHIEQTDKRLERIEGKLDQLVETKVKVAVFSVFAAIVISALTSKLISVSLGQQRPSPVSKIQLTQ
jgi:hypothetical protein